MPETNELKLNFIQSNQLSFSLEIPMNTRKMLIVENEKNEVILHSDELKECCLTF